MSRYVCIHGHFYQPPRENPWLETIEIQDSACPYHDWNERITAECYGPNSSARIINGERRIVSIKNNYARISFNFGPTLLDWIEQQRPDIHEAIVEADRRSCGWRGGHGNAIAQAYNHMILPLATRRDKETQILWGIRDFSRRFGRDPEGLWLPETAVDTETLEILSYAGIRFTVLAPRQAAQVRNAGARNWKDVSGELIDPSQPYSCRLPSGRSISLFFYDGPISRAVAFEQLLESGEAFAARLLGALSDRSDRAQLVNIATDGESYGHHHRSGEMALAYALDMIERMDGVRLTNYAEFLELHPPVQEVKIADNSSWSCVHGVERWRADCGCNSGGNPAWNQQWRTPLRMALDNLRERIDALYERVAGQIFRNPWSARNAYIDVVLDRSDEVINAFLETHTIGHVAADEVLRLLEMQRHALLMYTSCGWFFDEVSGIETVQILQYAGRASQLAATFGEVDAEVLLCKDLESAISNIPEMGNARAVYERFVSPSLLDLRNVGAHFAVSAVFQTYPSSFRIFCFDIEQADYERRTTGILSIAVGRARIVSRITRENAELSFCVLHFGGHTVSGGVRYFRTDDAYSQMKEDMLSGFRRGDFAELIRMLDANFGMHTYSLNDLFRDEQRRVLALLSGESLVLAFRRYEEIYVQNTSLMDCLRSMRIPVPEAFRIAAGFALNERLRKLCGEPDLDSDRINDTVEELRSWNVPVDQYELGQLMAKQVDVLLGVIEHDGAASPAVDELCRLIETIRALVVGPDYTTAQNRFHRMFCDLLASADGDRFRVGDSVDSRSFCRLGSLLHFDIERMISDSERGCHV